MSVRFRLFLNFQFCSLSILIREKVNEDFFTRTLSGGVITIVSSIFMMILFISEAMDYKSIQVVNELGVDRSRGELMKINIDITLHRLGCSHISIDVMDVSGEYHLHVDDHEILKQRIDWDGNRIKVDPHKSKVSGTQFCVLLAHEIESNQK